MELLTGTSGFSYKEWKGSFYPEDLPDGEMLAYYAGRLPAVEINHTFYRMPRASVLGGWADAVPPEFRFVLKASRRITHFGKLSGVEEETRYFLRTAGELGRRLGVVLFQLPPGLGRDLERLSSFLDGLGDPSRTAWEFRHRSWFDEEVYACLRERGAALCVADTDERDAEVVTTAEWGYLRLRKESYAEEALRNWAGRIRAAGWERAYAFFKHEDGARGPAMAMRLREIADAQG